MPHRLSLKARLILMIVSVAILVCILGGLMLRSMHAQMMEDRETAIRGQVENAISLVASYEALAEKKEMNEAEAQRHALRALTGLRFDDKEYFFILDKRLQWIAHGVNPKLIGKNMHDVSAADGTNMGTLFDNTLRDGNGRGLVSFVWDKPGSSTPQPKLSYIQTSPRWGWVVGTGLYIDDINTVLKRQLLSMGGQMLLIVLVTAALGLYILKSVMGQLGAEPAEAARVVREIASGRLDTRVPLRDGDRTSLMASISDMRDRLRSMVGEIVSSADELATLTGEMVSDTDTVAHNSLQQSESATSMAAFIEQMTVSISQISDHAREARQVSEESGQLSEQGGSVIARAVGEMKEIGDVVDQAAGHIGELVDKTRTISSIMQVISDIADQTNLLALNAAIEAARAGEQGRGFAVVADEVRKLSERTGKATQEIAAMIDQVQQTSSQSQETMAEVVNRVHTGRELAEAGGDAIARIRSSAGQVVTAVLDISQALNEQDSASQDIARNVERIAQVASSNADSANLASTTVTRVSELTDGLRSSVSHFTV
ncbi:MULTISPECIES: methyl-accepting chemotaxis protein [Microvirgula]|uniref:Methyl-accepting chemotaxis protein n=1 Tax=Microvirgula aerodenitrificans TaxID=57480 RepID=A0A2S0PD30_9NEIS|nr:MULTISPECIES: methyl-accepting chemotaxis protein [Microvirgula]AVY95242.1 methyl-accepting chemotaxis protein [Microvirgula aerodenitrificans]RAS14991.1 methyl-accepting chemotaxis sensory transducer with Cache sensor [Microvirgula sp. AG722]